MRIKTSLEVKKVSCSQMILQPWDCFWGLSVEVRFLRGVNFFSNFQLSNFLFGCWLLIGMFEHALIGFLELVLYKLTIAQYHFYLLYICKLRVVSNSLNVLLTQWLPLQSWNLHNLGLSTLIALEQSPSMWHTLWFYDRTIVNIASCACGNCG